MRKFIKIQQQNTIPIIMYLLSGILVLFINGNLLEMVVIFSIFMLSSFLITKQYKIIIFNIMIVLVIYLIICSIKLLSNLPVIISSIVSLTLAISMFFNSCIIVYLKLPTYQHIRLISLLPTQNAPFALLTAIRVIDIINISSSNILLAQKTRGFRKFKKLLFASYISNIIIVFFENLYYYLCNISLIKNITVKRKITYSFLLLSESLKLIICVLALLT